MVTSRDKKKMGKMTTLIKMLKMIKIVFFLGDSLASEFYMLTCQMTVPYS
jgi:hypothetical protein